MALLERVRAAFADEPSAREVAMFGGRAFMVHDAMQVSVLPDGSLLVRAAADRAPELVALPGAAPARMGARAMSAGWIAVEAAVLADDGQLAFWLGVARSR